MLSRRFFIAAPVLLAPAFGQAQPSAATFVGTWTGQVDGIGNARLIIIAVRPDGRVEGRMEFELQSHVSTFGDKVEPAADISAGVVSGSDLRIETALGGTYDLVLAGNQLAGNYTRGTTFRGRASFTRSQN